MKITRIQGQNILGVKDVDIKPRAAAVLFAGFNGSMKSSIADVVKLAIAQQPARGIKLEKKHFPLLVREGEKAGGAVVTFDDDHDMTFAFNLPDGKFSGPEISEAMRVSLDGARFTDMDDKERRTFLFDLTKCKPNAKAVQPRMLKLGCDPVKVETVLPLLRTGFPSVCDHAKEAATKAKGAWRALTGETYGAVKAESWEAAKPDLPEFWSETEAMLAEVARHDSMIAQQNESLGTIKQVQRAQAENSARRAALKDGADKVPSLTKQLADAKTDLAQYEPTVVALRARAGGTARVGLVHDMASFIQKNFEGKNNAADDLLDRYEAEHGLLSAVGKVDAEAQASLPEHEKGLLVMQNRVKNLERDLASATQAKGQYDALAPADDAVDASAEIAEIDALLATTKAARLKLENERLATLAALRNRDEADAKTKQAKAHHTDVVEWTKVADALAPGGIPAELLAEALAPVNEALVQAALDTDWKAARIEDDMSISAGPTKRPMALLSESEQWRVNAHIAQVVAKISGLNVLLLDRVDVLDLAGRAQLFAWIDLLVTEGEIDTALLFGTFKELPKAPYDTFECHWVQDGVIVGAQQQAAA